MASINRHNYQPSPSPSVKKSDMSSDAFMLKGDGALFADKSNTLVALQDKPSTQKIVKPSQTISSIPQKKLPDNAVAATLNLYNAVWLMSLAKNDPVALKKAQIEVGNQVKNFSASLGQTDFKLVSVKPREANNLIISSVQQNLKTLSPGSFGVDIEYTSKINPGQIAIRSKITGWYNPGVVIRGGTPFVYIPDLKKAPSLQNILTAGHGEVGIQLEASTRNYPNLNNFYKYVSANLTVIARGSSAKVTNDLNLSKKPGEKYTASPSSTLGLIVSGKFGWGPLLVGPYAEFGNTSINPNYVKGSTDPSKMNKYNPIGFIDPCNVTIAPWVINRSLAHIPNPIKRIGKAVLNNGGVQVSGKAVGTAGTTYGVITYVGSELVKTGEDIKSVGTAVKWLGTGLQKLLPKIGLRAAGAAAGRAGLLADVYGTAAAELGLAAGEFVAALALPVSLVVGAAVVGVGIYQWNEDRKAAYRANVLKLVKLGAYVPTLAMVATLGGLSKAGKSNVGSAARLISDVIDEAYKQGLVNIPELRKEWEKALSFKGNNLVQTQYGRLIAASVLGRKDVIADVMRQLIPRDKSGNAIHTGNNKLQDQLDNSILVTSLENSDSLKSLMLYQVTKTNNAPYQRIGAAYNHNKTYHKFTAKFMGGFVEAKPNAINDRGTTNWDVTLTTKDGMKAHLTIPMTGQFSLKQLENGQKVKNALVNKINAQRAHKKPVPANIHSFSTTMYGNSLVATPLFQLDGQIMWRVTAKSETGVTATVLETIDHQFSIDDLTNGHIFKMRLDAIMRGDAKSEI